MTSTDKIYKSFSFIFFLPTLMTPPLYQDNKAFNLGTLHSPLEPGPAHFALLGDIF